MGIPSYSSGSPVDFCSEGSLLAPHNGRVGTGARGAGAAVPPWTLAWGIMGAKFGTWRNTQKTWCSSSLIKTVVAINSVNSVNLTIRKNPDIPDFSKETLTRKLWQSWVGQCLRPIQSHPISRSHHQPPLDKRLGWRACQGHGLCSDLGKMHEDDVKHC